MSLDPSYFTRSLLRVPLAARLCVLGSARRSSVALDTVRDYWCQRCPSLRIVAPQLTLAVSSPTQAGSPLTLDCASGGLRRP